MRTFRKQGAYFPPKVNQLGHYASSVVPSGEGRSGLGQSLTFPASYFGWDCVYKRPNLSNCGLHSPPAEDGPECCRRHSPQTFESPHICTACRAVALGGVMDGCLSDPEKIIMEMHCLGDVRRRSG